MLTGYLLEALSYCELRGYLEHLDGSRKSYAPANSPRRILDVLLGSCGSRYCIERRRYRGLIRGLEYATTPHFILSSAKDRKPIAVGRVKLGDLRARESHYTRLLLDAYAVEENEGVSDIIMIVLAAQNPTGLLRGARYLIEEWNSGPARGEDFAVSIRFYDRSEALRAISRAVDILTGRTAPRPRPGKHCEYCSFKERCPLAKRPL